MLGLQDLTRFAQSEIRDQVERTENEDVVNERVNVLGNLVGRFGGQTSANKKRKENNTEEDKDENEDTSSRADAKTTTDPYAITEEMNVRGEENATYNILTSTVTAGTTASAAVESSTGQSEIQGQRSRQERRRSRIRRAFGSLPSLPIESPPDVTDLDVETGSITLPLGQDQSQGGEYVIITLTEGKIKFVLNIRTKISYGLNRSYTFQIYRHFLFVGQSLI